jgi:hypothetical protein
VKKSLFHSAVEASQKSWFAYEPFTLISTYKNFQRNFIKLYAPYEYLVKHYRTTTKNQVFPITTDYLDDNLEVSEENVALLRNAIELWRNATQTTDAIAPILFHYSWHCFNSFFAYTFFRWERQHSKSHGIHVSNLSDDVGKIMINISKKDGIFQRVVDTWSCLGCSLALSEYLPMFEGNKIEFQTNQMPLFKEIKCLELSQLLSFKPHEYEREYWKTFSRGKLVWNPSFSNSMGTPTKIMQSYLTLFVASSVARYRPVLWSSILAGETEEKANFALAYRNALLIYAEFGRNSNSFLNRLSGFINDLIKGKFELKQLP